MLKVGFLAANSCYLSTTHEYKIIDDYLDKLNQIFKKISICEREGNIKKFLNYPICHSGFQRLN